MNARRENLVARYAAIRALLEHRRATKRKGSAGAIYTTAAGKRTSAGLGKTPARKAQKIARRRNRP
jgi:hypothetical protein